jgi:hypothetical protein
MILEQLQTVPEKKQKHKFKKQATLALCALGIATGLLINIPYLLDEEVRISWENVITRTSPQNENLTLSKTEKSQLFQDFKNEFSTLNQNSWEKLADKQSKIASVLYSTEKPKETFTEFFFKYIFGIKKATDDANIPFEATLIALTNTPFGVEEHQFFTDDKVGAIQLLTGSYSNFYSAIDHTTNLFMKLQNEPDTWRVFNNMSLGQLDVEPIIIAKGLSKSPQLKENINNNHPKIVSSLDFLLSQNSILEDQKQTLQNSIENLINSNPEIQEIIWENNGNNNLLNSIGISNNNVDFWYQSKPTYFWAKPNTNLFDYYHQTNNPTLTFLKDVSFAPKKINIWEKLKQHPNISKTTQKSIEYIKTQISQIKKQDKKYILAERYAALEISKQEYNLSLSVQLSVAAISEWNSYIEKQLGNYQSLTKKGQIQYQLALTSLVELGDNNALAIENWGIRSEDAYTPEAMLNSIINQNLHSKPPGFQLGINILSEIYEKNWLLNQNMVY